MEYLIASRTPSSLTQKPRRPAARSRPPSPAMTWPPLIPRPDSLSPAAESELLGPHGRSSALFRTAEHAT
ncbi:hypothetical protein ACFWFF_01990 [Streptomyces sp. NPDC060223]|uniref:hypothetical protein n=1 Tax=unclassified Streptomyces TaxID=2593676 RepID=UPI0036340C76